MKTSLSTFATKQTSTITNFHLLPCSINTHYTTATGNILSPVSKLRDLGISISKDLSWSTHIRTICDKARQMTFVELCQMSASVFSILHTRKSDTMILLYKSLERCHLEYCSLLWNPTKISDIQELERAFSARINTVQHLHYWDRLMKLGHTSLQRRGERSIVLHMWKICYGIAPNELNIRFEYHPRMGLTAKVPPLRKDCASNFVRQFVWCERSKDVELHSS